MKQKITDETILKKVAEQLVIAEALPAEELDDENEGDSDDMDTGR